ILELKKELEFLRGLQKYFQSRHRMRKRARNLAGLQLSFPEEVDPEDLILCGSNDNAKNNEEQSLIDDKSYEQYLNFCVAMNSLSLIINVYTVQKLYSEWTFNDVSNIFKLPAHYKNLPKFTCGIDKFEDKKSQELILHLIKELNIRQSTVRGDSEAYNSHFVIPFLAVASSICGDKAQIYPEEYIQGRYGRGP
ncbi:16848_t:CDS:2, partial [Gigaspora rosea]